MATMNALAPVTLDLSSNKVVGFSRSGLATWVMLPELGCVFDMGECPLEALSLDHVFLTHAHGDHARCFPRHDALRHMIGIKRPAVYYLPLEILELAQEWLRASMRFEGKTGPLILPDLRGLEPGGPPEVLAHRANLSVQAFAVDHTVPSLGYTLFDHKRKLRPEFHGRPGAELAQLRLSGVEITRQVHQPRVTFIGDCTAQTLERETHIWDSPLLIIEATFVEEGEEDRARARGHTHLAEIAQVLIDGGSAIRCRDIVLKHFSMKSDQATIEAAVARLIPRELQDRVHLLL